MTVRAIDPETGDIVTSGEQFLYKRNNVTQTIKTRLKLFYGENFRNIEDGTPWIQVIFSKVSNTQAKNFYLRQRIIETPEVLRLLRFETSFDIDTREYDVSCQVLTTYGQVDIENLQGLTPLTTQETLNG